MNYTIFSNQDESNYQYTIFKSKEVIDVINCFECNYYKIIGVDISDIDTLNKALKENLTDEEELQEFLDNIKPDTSCCYLEGEYTAYKGICFDMNYNRFFDLSECDTLKGFQYWDGHNWKWFASEEFEEVELSDSNVELDEWNGHNWQTDGMGLHQNVYKILNNVNYENCYLIFYESQWSGSLDQADIKTFEEVVEHLEELGRDEEYLPKIESLK